MTHSAHATGRDQTGGSTAAVRDVRGRDSRVSHAGRRRGKRWQTGGSERWWRKAGSSERSAVGGTSVQLNAGKLTRKRKRDKRLGRKGTVHARFSRRQNGLSSIRPFRRPVALKGGGRRLQGGE